MQISTRFLAGTALLLSAVSAHAQTARPSLTGDWGGTVAGTGFVMRLLDPAAGPRTATLDIPEQGAKGLLLQFTAPADSVYLRLAQPVARFAGRRSADGQQLVGEWQQGLRAFPLTLARAGGTARLVRLPDGHLEHLDPATAAVAVLRDALDAL